MRDDVRPDAPATEEELLAARGLAEALDSGHQASNGAESDDVVRLFGAVARDIPVGEIAVRRLRNDLVMRASRRPARSLWRPFAVAASAAAAMGLVAVLAGRMANRPSGSLLAEREQMARAALSAVAATGGGGLAGAYETRWQYRNDSNLESARYQRLTGAAAAETSSQGGDS